MVFAKNRKALFDYDILEKFTAGIELKGYEVKAIREGKVNMEASYVQELSGQLFVVNMHVGHYSKQSQQIAENEQNRSRRLLLTSQEIDKIKRELAQKGKTAIPLALISHRNMVKLELAIVKGRKKYDKKNVEKEKQIKKDMERDSKEVKRLFGV